MGKTRDPAGEVVQLDVPEAAAPTDAEPSHDVGYGKPPAHGRFKPGRSGNPKGRPRGAKSYKAIVAAALHEKITVSTPRGRKRMTKLEALIQTNMNAALKGDPKATDQILKIARDHGLANEVADAIDAAASAALREEDRAILERHLAPADSADEDK
ncbi:MAG: hypothetical protein JJ913_13075 [Rhizobiaceae bacterium]|nr:hypothetical protein [Rhizobiaceae bacterium]